MKYRIFFIVLLSLFFSISWAESKQTWQQFVAQLRVDALAEGVRPEVFDEAFKDIKEPNHAVLHFDRTQPEKRIDYMKYRSTRADKFRIQQGRSEYKRHGLVLDKIGNEYGVSPCFILSLWGLETSYGNFMGSFPVIKSLATLAYDNRRSAFFRKELLLALHILNEGHVSLKDFKGEWAGASGHPQFLPSSWQKYAVDYDKDGHKDIWRSHGDAFASIANYLVHEGWKRDQPWAVEVEVPKNLDAELMDRKVKRTLGEWRELGVRPVAGEQWPSDENILVSIIQPNGGPTLMVFNNFNVIMRWNHSIYYAGTVGYLAEQICHRRL